jgi:hypothetical protein
VVLLGLGVGGIVGDLVGDGVGGLVGGLVLGLLVGSCLFPPPSVLKDCNSSQCQISHYHDNPALLPYHLAACTLDLHGSLNWSRSRLETAIP